MPDADEVLLMDLLNSTPVVDGVRHDLLDGDGASWARAHDGTGSAAELDHLRRTRDALQDVVRGAAAAEVLTPLLAGVHLLPAVEPAGLRWTLGTAGEQRLSARALLEWGRVQETMPGRLRACANTECRQFLLDRSKPNRARWCSMKACGNRLKARRHYERTRRSG